jgi:hypothetical protein
MRRLIVGLLFALLVAGCQLTPAFAHPHDLLVCGRAVNATPISEDVLPNGLYAERYDTNGDGKADMVALSAVTGTVIHKSKGGDTVEVQHAEHPTFYLVDRDFDTHPDVVLIDKGEGGKCADIVLYHDLNRPQTPNDEEVKGTNL